MPTSGRKPTIASLSEILEGLLADCRPHTRLRRSERILIGQIVFGKFDKLVKSRYSGKNRQPDDLHLAALGN
jgi:hypothetical protein